MSRELGLTQDWPVVIAGIGNLGHALANYGGFSERGLPGRRPGRRRPVEGRHAGRHGHDPPHRRAARPRARAATSPSASSPPPPLPPRTSPTAWWPPAITSILNFAPGGDHGPGRHLAAQGRPRRRAADPVLLPAAAVGSADRRGPRRRAHASPGKRADPVSYPVNLVLDGRPCLVVGGGTVALGKVHGPARRRRRGHRGRARGQPRDRGAARSPSSGGRTGGARPRAYRFVITATGRPRRRPGRVRRRRGRRGVRERRRRPGPVQRHAAGPGAPRRPVGRGVDQRAQPGLLGVDAAPPRATEIGPEFGIMLDVVAEASGAEPAVRRRNLATCPGFRNA